MRTNEKTSYIMTQTMLYFINS